MDTQPVLAPAIDASASVMCQLLSPEGDPLGAALYLPQNVGPPQLQEIVNQLLHNVLLYSFFFLSFPYIQFFHLSLLPSTLPYHLPIANLFMYCIHSFRRRSCPMHSTLETRSSLSSWALTCGKRMVG